MSEMNLQQPLQGTCLFNINNYVSVRLTREGINRFYEHYERFGIVHNGPTIDADGWYKTQLWDLMQIFGEHIGMCKPLVFTTDIILHGEP